jgi:hypothetical protein
MKFTLMQPVDVQLSSMRETLEVQSLHIQNLKGLVETLKLEVSTYKEMALGKDKEVHYLGTSHHTKPYKPKVPFIPKAKVQTPPTPPQHQEEVCKKRKLTPWDINPQYPMPKSSVATAGENLLIPEGMVLVKKPM